MTVMLSRRGALAGGIAVLAAPRLLAPVGSAQAQDAAAPPILVYPRKVGALEVTAISDGYLAIPASFFVNIAPEQLGAALEAAFLDPSGPNQAGITAHLVRDGDRTLLIDTGTADLFGPTAGRMPAALAALGVAPEEVDAVLLTHMHPDHLGGLLAGNTAAFPNATVHVSEADLAFWTDEAIASKAPAEVQPFFARARATAAGYGDRLIPFGAEGEVVPGVTSLTLPGHTPGHTGFRLASDGAEIVVFGDVVSLAAVQFAHPGAGLVFDVDPALAAETRARLLDAVAADGTLVAGTHLPFPGIGHVARAGDAFDWVGEEWRYQ